MKRIVLFMLALALLFGGLTSCTKAERETQSRKKAAENGQLLRTVRVWNARSDHLIWQGEGFINLQNSSNGDYEVLAWYPDGTTSRDLFNGRDNYIHVHDMTVAEQAKYRAEGTIFDKPKPETE
jgi:hypothetical protein